jgi:hypothetical protein
MKIPSIWAPVGPELGETSQRGDEADDQPGPLLHEPLRLDGQFTSYRGELHPPNGMKTDCRPFRSGRPRGRAATAT